jgi:hypothetical protein
VVLRLGGLLQPELILALADDDSAVADELRFRRLGTMVGGSWGNVSFRIVPEFPGGRVRGQDVHVEIPLQSPEPGRRCRDRRPGRPVHDGSPPEGAGDGGRQGYWSAGLSATRSVDSRLKLVAGHEYTTWSGYETLRSDEHIRGIRLQACAYEVL